MEKTFRGVREISVDDLTPYKANAKKHSDRQITQIANSIKMAGFVQPVVIDGDNVVIIGHGRLAAAKRLGYTSVPCIMVDDLTPEQVKALRIADNKLNESDWDISVLAQELDEILDLDLTDLGFNEAELLELKIDPLEDMQEEEEGGTDDVPTWQETGQPTKTPQERPQGGSKPESGELSLEELKAYAEQAETMLSRRIIIVYRTDEEEAYLRSLLGIKPEERIPVTINTETLMAHGNS